MKVLLGLIVLIGMGFSFNANAEIPSKKQRNPGLSEILAGKAAVNKVSKRVAEVTRHPKFINIS